MFPASLVAEDAGSLFHFQGTPAVLRIPTKCFRRQCHPSEYLLPRSILAFISIFNNILITKPCVNTVMTLVLRGRKESRSGLKQIVYIAPSLSISVRYDLVVP